MDDHRLQPYVTQQSDVFSEAALEPRINHSASAVFYDDPLAAEGPNVGQSLGEYSGPLFREGGGRV